MKTCAGCGEDKPLEAFSPSKRGKFGRAFYCRVCAAARRREFYARTVTDDKRAAEAARLREWLAKPTNRAATRARNRKWAKDNPAKVNARNAAWRRANPDRAREHQARYRQKHPEVGQAHVERRRAQMLSAGGDLLTTAEWRSILDEFQHRCAYCLAGGVRLQQEHMQPLSKGGLHSKSNVVPACAPCNLRKGRRDLLQSMAVIGIKEGTAA